MKNYLVTATVVDKSPDGWHGTRQIPSFVLIGDIQGIRNEADAEAIARRLLEAPNREVRAYAQVWEG